MKMSSGGHNNYEEGQSMKPPDVKNMPKGPTTLPKVKALHGNGNWHVCKK